MATVTPSFLTAVSACTWLDTGGGCLRTTAGTLVRPAAAASSGHDQPWTLSTVPAGYAIPHAVYALLVGATAQSDGSFVDTAGGRWWLALDATGSKVAAESGGPPPPPPP